MELLKIIFVMVFLAVLATPALIAVAIIMALVRRNNKRNIGAATLGHDVYCKRHGCLAGNARHARFCRRCGSSLSFATPARRPRRAGRRAALMRMCA